MKIRSNDEINRIINDGTLPDKSNVLTLDNATTFTPDSDYEPATKKYVDDGLSDSLGDKADKTNVLELDNTDEFTPDSDYEPATKKYVDDNADITLVEANGYDLGVGQTWQDVTATRAESVWYTNTTGKPICISIIWLGNHNGSGGVIKVSTDGGATSTTVEDFSDIDSARGSVGAIIPDGTSYSFVDYGYGLISTWAELR